MGIDLYFDSEENSQFSLVFLRGVCITGRNVFYETDSYYIGQLT